MPPFGGYLKDAPRCDSGFWSIGTSGLAPLRGELPGVITRYSVLIGHLLNSLLPVIFAAALCFSAVPRADAQPSLSITKTHSGSFTQGQPDATYTVTVSNRDLSGPTASAVTVTENLPSGLTLGAMSGANRQDIVPGADIAATEPTSQLSNHYCDR